MKIVIFAGGVGSRLWPLSRENSPKQFDKIFKNKSTIQLAVDRVAPYFGFENIFIQTIEIYKNIIKEQIPEIPEENILIEPARRNLGPAVCFSLLQLKKRGFDGALAILWADHLMERVSEFVSALQAAESLIKENGRRFIFLGERARFANNNLGWVNTGERIGKIDSLDYFKFLGWKYKPDSKECDRMYKSGIYFWNPGYFITSIDFLLNKYKLLAPDIFEKVNNGNYKEAESTHFDRAIIEKVDLSDAVVIKTNMGWSDPGTLYALKEALEDDSRSNVTKGLVSTLNTTDSLIYNLEKDKLMATVGLDGMVVVNTKDALIVVPKEEVVNVTKLIVQLKKEGRSNYL